MLFNFLFSCPKSPVVKYFSIVIGKYFAFRDEQLVGICSGYPAAYFIHVSGTVLFPSQSPLRSVSSVLSAGNVIPIPIGRGDFMTNYELVFMWRELCFSNSGGCPIRGLVKLN